jgi:ABC-type transporter Mla subunit MlaD
VAIALLVGVVVVLLLVVLSSGASGHKLTTVVPQARYMLPGMQVRAAGQVVGKIAKAKPTRDGRARLELQIDDSKVWPLPRGTKFRMRWNGSITYSGRYVELDIPPRATHGDYADNGVIPSSDVISNVEADDVFRALDDRTRRDLKATLAQGGPALGRAAHPLRRALHTAPPALEQARAVIEDLGGDEQSLDTLVKSTDAVVHAVRASDVGTLVQNASTTFAATADKATALKQALSETPPALAAARGTLAHAESTLHSVSELTSRLAPGVTQVRRALPPLTRVLRTLYAVGPDARVTLRTARLATPDLNPLLTKARTVMPLVESITREGAKQLACVRPYSPEIAGLATSWSRFLLYQDNQDKYARAALPAMPFNETTLTSAQVNKVFPWLRYAFPAPPGWLANQPWFIPQCGLGPDTVDVNKDPEIGRAEPGG